MSKLKYILLILIWFNKYTFAASFTPSALRDGSVVLTLEGEIEHNDGAIFRGLVKAADLNGAPVRFLFLNSGGGSVYGGADIAITVRNNYITTVVSDNAVCASACFMPFIAGIKKHYTEQSRIGVHSAVDSHHGENNEAKSITIDMARFLTALGTPPSIIGKMVAMKPNEIAWLTSEDLSSINGSSQLKNEQQSSSYITNIQSSIQTTPIVIPNKKIRAEARKLNAIAIDLIHQQQSEKAAVLLSNAYNMSPFDAEITGNYGYALFLSGEYEKARDVLALAIKLKPKRGSTWNNLGQVLVNLNELDWATDCFVNYYNYSSRKDIAIKQLSLWQSDQSINLRAVATKAKSILGLQ